MGVLRPRISDYSGGKEQCAVRRASPGLEVRVASESRLLVPSRLRNFLRGEVCQKRVSQAATSNYGIVDRLQILEGDRVGGNSMSQPLPKDAPPRDSSVRQSIWLRIAHSLNESDLVLACAHVLHTNGAVDSRNGCKQPSGLATSAWSTEPR